VILIKRPERGVRDAYALFGKVGFERSPVITWLKRKVKTEGSGRSREERSHYVNKEGGRGIERKKRLNIPKFA